jgi:cell division septum initiation protein DivIVA
LDWLPVVLINLLFTSVCIFTIGLYFSYREKEISKISEQKLREVKKKYIGEITERKEKEKEEIKKLKQIVDQLEIKQLEIDQAKNNAPVQPQAKNLSEEEAEELIAEAKEKAHHIEEEARKKAHEYLEDQKKEVQIKMVDLVMGVAKKVFNSTLNYDDHLELVKKSLKEMEGEVEAHEKH